MSLITKQQKIAAECLVKRQFERAETICRKQLKELKGEDQESYAETTEQLLVVLIQSLAEMDQWQDVLPIVNDVYGAIENVPPSILKYCMLLHSKVQEYTTCTTLYHVWCRAKDSGDQAVPYEDLGMLADVYVRKVLIPQEKYDCIDAFLETTSFSDEERQHLQSCYQQMIEKKTTPPSPPIEEITPTHAASSANTIRGAVTDPQSFVGGSTSQQHQDRLVAKCFRVISVVMRYIQNCGFRLGQVIPWVTGLLTLYFIISGANLDSSSTVRKLDSIIRSLRNRLVSLLFP